MRRCRRGSISARMGGSVVGHLGCSANGQFGGFGSKLLHSSKPTCHTARLEASKSGFRLSDLYRVEYWSKKATQNLALSCSLSLCSWAAIRQEIYNPNADVRAESRTWIVKSTTDVIVLSSAASRETGKLDILLRRPTPDFSWEQQRGANANASERQEIIVHKPRMFGGFDRNRKHGCGRGGSNAAHDRNKQLSDSIGCSERSSIGRGCCDIDENASYKHVC